MSLAILEYITLVKTVLSGGAGAWREYRKRMLSEDERELLIAAAMSGEFFLLTAGEAAGPMVRAGLQTFADENDPAVAARYRESFKSLVRRGCIEHVADQRFTLTRDGFTKARDLIA